MGKDSYSAVRDVERFTRRTRFTAGTTELSSEDQYNLTFCFRASYCLLVDLLPTGDSGLHDYGCFLTGTQPINVLKVAKSLKAYSDLLVEKVVTWSGEGPVVTMQDFKHLARSADLYLGLVTPLTSVITENEVRPTIDGFRVSYQWFEFLRHVNVKSLDLEEENVSTYLDFEDSMASWSYPPEVVRSLSDVMSDWCSEFSLEDFRPSHGPGSISREKGKLGIAYKDCLLATDVRLNYFVNRLPSSFAVFPAAPPSTLSRWNEIVFVPKKMDKNRVISKEPCTLAYFQQGVARCITHTVLNRFPLKRHVDLSNQTMSQDVAWEGSVTGEYATLDLSNASDSVTLSLVKAVIHQPDLRRALVCTRSDGALLPHGKKTTLRKFAPMGSAVCFPIETLIFAGACEMAVREVSGHISHDDDYVVYGDDIVIRQTYVEATLRLLSALHFSVNVAKSFFGTGKLKFREACGGYFLNGNDVTPVRLSRRLALIAPGARDHQVGPRVSLIALCNELLRRGFLTSRKCVLSQLKEYYPSLRGIPFTRLDDDEMPFALQTFADCCTNYNIRTRRPSLKEEWWGADVVEIYDVCAKADAKLKPHSTLSPDALEWARWYEYWKDRAYDTLDSLVTGTDDYTPLWGVVYAPEPLETRPQRTFDVRKWRSAI